MIQQYKELTYRVFENIEYCQNPVDDIQKLNIFVPEAYYHGKTINGYTKESAPVFMPNTVGGYLPGPADYPGLNRYGMDNAIVQALRHGYVVVSAGVRGRTSGKVSHEFFEGSKDSYIGKDTGNYTGKAPAFIVDMKAAIRFLRQYKDKIPGNVERIITDGTSAGGALSALTGTSGNHPDFLPYLKQIQAYDQRDDVFASICFCPIHNLENADMAYEWQFYKENCFYKNKHVKTENGIEKIPFEGKMSEEQMKWAYELKQMFSSYIQSFGLSESVFKDMVKQKIIESAQKEFQTRHSETYLKYIMAKNSEIDKMDCFIFEKNRIVSMDWDAYISRITRMKETPAFDDVYCKSPENDEFDGKHFTDFSFCHSKVSGIKADDSIVQMINPLTYIGKGDMAKHFWIRHGSFDRDTSFAIPCLLAYLLKQQSIDVNFELPWGLVHSGDYDLELCFQWIDSLFEKETQNIG